MMEEKAVVATSNQVSNKEANTRRKEEFVITTRFLKVIAVRLSRSCIVIHTFFIRRSTVARMTST